LVDFGVLEVIIVGFVYGLEDLGKKLGSVILIKEYCVSDKVFGLEVIWGYLFEV
jgi:hypothetical protein